VTRSVKLKEGGEKLLEARRSGDESGELWRTDGSGHCRNRRINDELKQQTQKDFF
jgi:hypothetical protein